MVSVVGIVAVVAVILESAVSASSTKIVAALATLLGTVVAAAFAFVGVLLKHSIDQHGARLADEAEARLGLETSIKAVELLRTPEGEQAASAQYAAALFVLGSKPLLQLDLAVALLNENWDARNISSSAAVWTISRAITDGDIALQGLASATLIRHSSRLMSADGEIQWPACADAPNWPKDADYSARTGLLHACVKALVQSGPDDRTNLPNWFVIELDMIRREDPASEVKCGATLALDALLAWLVPRRLDEPALLLADGPVDITSLQSEVSRQAAESYGAAAHIRDLVDIVRDWVT